MYGSIDMDIFMPSKRTIKVPDQVTVDEAFTIGTQAKQMSWTDKELGDQIGVLRIVAAYLMGRKDCGIVAGAMNQELAAFESYKFFRERK
jgi:hypothetical protein